VPIATINGARLHYVQIDAGDGLPRDDLVMVHGLATSLAFWYLPYAPVFAKRFRVTLFDLRGHGRSETTPDGYSPNHLAGDLRGLMDHLGIARAHVIAHSFGGVVALNLARQDASRIRSLVLCDTHISAARHSEAPREWGNRLHVQSVLDRHHLALDTHDPYFGYRLLTELAHWQMRGDEVPPELQRMVGSALGRKGTRTAAQWVRLMSETTAEQELMGDDGLTLDALRRLLFPIVALYGDHSQALLTGADLLDVWPHAEFRRVRDAGHFFPTSRPDDVIAECERFWSGAYSRRPVVRSGEELRRHFRSDRLFKAEAMWYFTTREHHRLGPFHSADDARAALARYVAALADAA
jgi:pimeloyl-ACP methyl ester carboxylesterase